MKTVCVRKKLWYQNSSSIGADVKGFYYATVKNNCAKTFLLCTAGNPNNEGEMQNCYELPAATTAVP